MRTGRLGVWVGLLALLVVAVANAFAAEEVTTTDDYRALAEPICKTNVLANKRIFQGAKAEVKQGKLKQASKHFTRAATAFGKTIRQLAAVPQPPEYEAKLGKWLGILGTEKGIIEKIGRALAAEDKHKAESFSVDLNHNSIKANNTVIPFGFNYCRIEPSRFG